MYLKAKAFSINLPTALQPQKKNRHRILFIYIEHGKQLWLLFGAALPMPRSQSVKRVGGKKGCSRWQHARGSREEAKNAGDRLPRSKQIKRPEQWGAGPEVCELKANSAFYVDFICNSRESRNLHKQIEFCIHFLCPFSKQNIKGLVCLARRKGCYSIFCKRTREKRRERRRHRHRQMCQPSSRMCIEKNISFATCRVTL